MICSVTATAPFLSARAYGSPRALHIKGETLGHVHFAINYLNNPDSFRLGERVIVIGAGNAAMDVARTALRKGRAAAHLLFPHAGGGRQPA